MTAHSSVENTRLALLQQIKQLESQLEQAKFDLQRLDSQTTNLGKVEAEDEPTLSVTTHVNGRSSPAAKVALFMDRFSGRKDVYAHRWRSTKSGKTGWSPTTRYGSDFHNPKPSDYVPLSPSVIEQHLRGNNDTDWHVGLYPLLEDDRCRLLVCDFDKGDWQRDASAYAKVCTAAGVSVLAEISRSGEGAHVWIFFEDLVSAAQARTLGAIFLRRAMISCPAMSFDSYDRFFPSQDKLPLQSTGRARLGNLIALPLQGTCRRRGTSVFADPVTWVPFEDQFAALSAAEPLQTSALTAILSGAPMEKVGPVDSLPHRPQRAVVRAAVKKHLASPGAASTIKLKLDSRLHVPLEHLPGALIVDLKHLASIPNPDFYLKQAQRRSTYGTPRLVTRFEHDAEELRMPRGLADEVKQRLTESGYTVKLSKSRRQKATIDIEFAGELRQSQQLALKAITKHDTGVLVAPPGTGKTVMACALIARRQVPTAILVGNRELLSQWRARLQEFLTIPEKDIGQLGGGRRKRRGIIDLIMWQSIAHRESDPTLLNEYGQIIIDECHGIAAPAVQAALEQVDVPRWTGLTATPYRADKMDGLITMQCGPIRHTLVQETRVKRELRVHETQFTTEERGQDGASIQAIYTELAQDEARNALVASAINAAAVDERCSLVLTNRVEHLNELARLIKQQSETPVLRLHGQLSQAERRDVRDQLENLARSRKPFTLVAIDKVAGEGLDLPTLDTLFLTVPVSFKGRIVQQLGRITRGISDKSDRRAIVHDFRDSQVPLFEVMHSRRRRVMQREGFVGNP